MKNDGKKRKKKISKKRLVISSHMHQYKNRSDQHKKYESEKCDEKKVEKNILARHSKWKTYIKSFTYSDIIQNGKTRKRKTE